MTERKVVSFETIKHTVFSFGQKSYNSLYSFCTEYDMFYKSNNISGKDRSFNKASIPWESL